MSMSEKSSSSKRTPKHTTHVRLDTHYRGSKRMAIVTIIDMDCLAGAPGTVTYLKKLSRGRYKELGSFEFDGKWPLERKDNDS